VKTLLDTNILTELVRPNGNPAVISAFEQIPPAGLYLSVLSVGEIAKGITLLDPGKKKKYLASWLAGLEKQFAERILTIDVETSHIWGELTARAQKRGTTILPTDGLLAATALRHGLHIMTRNTRHFQATGALILDPWQGT
jgi:predicted nucleic acid-binding protein